MEVIKLLIHEVGFPDKDMECRNQCQKILSLSLSGKVVKVLPFKLWKKHFFMQGHYTADHPVFWYLYKETRLMLPSVKGYRSAFNSYRVGTCLRVGNSIA